jgi:hypothetical protein
MKIIFALTEHRAKSLVLNGLIITPRTTQRGRGRTIRPEDIIWADYPTEFPQEFHDAVRPCFLDNRVGVN